MQFVDGHISGFFTMTIEIFQSRRVNSIEHLPKRSLNGLKERFECLLQQHDNRVEFLWNSMWMSDDPISVDRPLCFHGEDPKPKPNLDLISFNEENGFHVRQDISSKVRIIDFDGVSLQSSPSYTNTSNLLYSHHYPCIHSLFHRLPCRYSIKTIDRVRNPPTSPSKILLQFINNPLSGRLTYVFRTIRLQDVGDFRVFHPECVVIRIDRDRLSEETRS